MSEKKDHDPFPDSVTADADGEGGGTEDENKDQTGQRVVDGQVEGVGEKGGSGKTRQVDAQGDSHKAEGVPAPMRCVTNSVKEVENDGTPGKFFRKREMRKKARQKKSQKQKHGTQRTKPRQGLSKGEKGGIGPQAVCCPGKKKKGEAKERGHAEDAIEENGKSGPGFFFREPTEKVVEADGVSAGGADEKEIKKETNESQMNGPQIREMDFLQAKKEPEASSTKADGEKGDEKSGDQPSGMGGGESLCEIRPVYLSRQEAEDAEGDPDANPRRQAL
jgi:hypothetical protein